MPQIPLNELTLTRVYDASVGDVWDAWTDPEQVAVWWGPRGFTLTTHSKDLRVGGSWHYTMHGPDGTDYENTTLYHVVEPLKTLVYDHGGHAERPPLFRVHVQFSERGGHTTMQMRMVFPSAEAATEIGRFIKQVNGYATWDRLAEFLAKKHLHQDRFVINRTIDAPVETIFDQWTVPGLLSQWLPPTGFTMQFLVADLKAGGSTFWSMTDGGSTTMYGRAEYREIERPKRIVYTQQFCDAQNRQVLRHPHLPVWPATLHTTVEFVAEDSNHTRVTVTWQPDGPVTEEEISAFNDTKPGMTVGWSGSFDKLESLLGTTGR